MLRTRVVMIASRDLQMPGMKMVDMHQAESNGAQVNQIVPSLEMITAETRDRIGTTNLHMGKTTTSDVELHGTVIPDTASVLVRAHMASPTMIMEPARVAITADGQLIPDLTITRDHQDSEIPVRAREREISTVTHNLMALVTIRDEIMTIRAGSLATGIMSQDTIPEDKIRDTIVREIKIGDIRILETINTVEARVFMDKVIMVVINKAPDRASRTGTRDPKETILINGDQMNSINNLETTRGRVLHMDRVIGRDHTIRETRSATIRNQEMTGVNTRARSEVIRMTMVPTGISVIETVATRILVTEISSTATSQGMIIPAKTVAIKMTRTGTKTGNVMHLDHP